MDSSTTRYFAALCNKPANTLRATRAPMPRQAPATERECTGREWLRREAGRVQRVAARALACAHDAGVCPAHDLENLVCQTIDDVALSAPAHVFVFESRAESIRVLGDENDLAELIAGVVQMIVALEPNGADLTLWALTSWLGGQPFAGLRLCTRVSVDEAARAARILRCTHRFVDAMGARMESHLNRRGNLELALWLPCVEPAGTGQPWQAAA